MSNQAPNKMQSGLALAAWLILCYAVSLVGAQFSPGEWYNQLATPPWTPPGWLFPPVWITLYALMGIAAWQVWKQGGFTLATVALSFFFLQLLFNGLWSWIFFGLHRIGLALLDLSLLWLALVATLIAFWRRQTAAGLLLIPYLLWVSFAWLLNFSIWQLNT